MNFRLLPYTLIWPCFSNISGDANFHRRISCPTLLVYGLKDPFVSLVEMCEMERTIPRSYLELLPLAGHMVMLDQPRELNVMMRRYVQRKRAICKKKILLSY